MVMFTDADFGYPAYRGFVDWAWRQPEYREAFTKETGIAFSSVRMEPAEQFVFWISEHWGLEDCPPEIREAILESKRLK